MSIIQKATALECKRREIGVSSAVLRKFDVSCQELPILALREHLLQFGRDVYLVHPKKFEHVIESVLSDFYECEARVVGKSHDGGIDLVLLDPENLTLVQIKRRTRSNSVEPVASIREFLGAALLNHRRNVPHE